MRCLAALLALSSIVFTRFLASEKRGNQPQIPTLFRQHHQHLLFQL
jgi:hypothetical protein